MADRTKIIAIGNRDRRDDGVGPSVADRVGVPLAGRADIVVTDGDPGDVLEAMSGCDRLILIDAVAARGSPGSVIRETDRRRLATLRPSSSHLLGPAEVLGLAEVLDRLPAEVVVYGIEGIDFSPGSGLTAEVDEGAEIVAGMILEEFADA